MSIPKATTSWTDKALRRLAKLHESHTSVIGEDVRRFLSHGRLPAPGHHNAYGALIRIATDRGILVPTGTMGRMTAPTSHGRMTPIYRVAKVKRAA